MGPKCLSALALQMVTSERFFNQVYPQIVCEAQKGAKSKWKDYSGSPDKIFLNVYVMQVFLQDEDEN